MRAFAQKPNQPQKAAYSNTARTQVSPTGDEALEAGAAEPASLRFEHDFSRVPVHPPAPAGVQMKLAIDEPGDAYEKEAEQVSDQVMRIGQGRERLQASRVHGGKE